MASTVKRITRRVPHVELLRTIRSTRKLLAERAGRSPQFSHFGDEKVIARLLQAYPPPVRMCVDLGASDGVEGSTTLPLFRAGWSGLAAELDPGRFAFLSRVLERHRDVGLARCAVIPPRVVPLLRGHGIPTEFGFLNLDIDSYDHDVLDALLGEFRPGLMCVEINERFPPPLRFVVRWTPEGQYTHAHLYGQSLSALADLAARHGYVIVELLYNNAFLVPADRAGSAALTPEAAYRRGYLAMPDRRELFHWNAELEPMLTMSPEATRDFIAERFTSDIPAYELKW